MRWTRQPSTLQLWQQETCHSKGHKHARSRSATFAALRTRSAARTRAANVCRNAHSERALRTRSRSVQSQRALFLSLAQSQAPSAKLAMFGMELRRHRARNAASLGWVKLSPRAAYLALQALSRCDGLAVGQAAESTPDQGRRLQSHDSRATSIATRSTYSSEQQWKHIPSHLMSYPTSRLTSRSRLLGAFGAYCRRGGLSKSSEQPTTASSVAPRIAR